MSYDFFVYGSEALSHDDVATRMSNIRGLSFDPAESGPSDAQTWGFLVPVRCSGPLIQGST
ncbi:hypothetical protein ACKLTP_10280, partial [Paenarthrobacter ureafaciens]|uniref:hypothetical protein n=1 Tax=Paenarthrobacter ureafaciens TaxID=37931 RepID=UPI00397940E4